MEVDKIRELVRLVEESQIQELELSNRGETIRISKNGNGVAAPGVGVPGPVAPVAPPATAAAAATPEPAPAAPASNLTPVESPMVGTYYRSPNPEADPFVQVGDRVEKGTVVCIVEAMKVMNEIESEVSGVVKEILVEDGQPVEFGQALFLVDPA